MKYLNIVLATVLLYLCSAVQAHNYSAGKIDIDHPWASPTAIASVPAAVYLIIDNKGKIDDKLISLFVEKEIAKIAEIHETTNKNGLIGMRKISDGLNIPAGGKVVFAPGEKHIMLRGLTKRLEDGDKFSVVLNFEKAGPVDVSVYVENNNK